MKIEFGPDRHDVRHGVTVWLVFQFFTPPSLHAFKPFYIPPPPSS
jgi:hypothetical protein